MDTAHEHTSLINHDQLHQLFITDPVAFEQERQRLIEQTIKTAKPENQARLRALQWNIDQQLSHYHHPVARLNKMIELFYDGLFRFRDALNGKYPTRTNTSVLPFKK